MSVCTHTHHKENPQVSKDLSREKLCLRVVTEGKDGGRASEEDEEAGCTRQRQVVIGGWRGWRE